MAAPMPATGSGPAGGAVVTGGAPGELSVTFDNIATTTVRELATTFTLTGKGGGAGLDVKLRAPGSDWKPLTGTNTGAYQLAQGEKLTLQVRITAGAQATLGDYRFSFAAKSELLPSGSAPSKKYTCPQLAGTFGGTFTVTDHAVATTSPAPAAPTTPAATPTRTPTQLADTGAGANTFPIAVTGTATIAVGGALLLVTRRRRAED
ncbi:LPXTG cell wall anchor domain-containing protein [Streptomyces kaniharaensis]|uniref:LPXTG cell wall anchor domain-containing protein n=2 Tax=Streptomyces kaniharaensis TaxID=212423 RepID=A0A6N7KTZ2_9ACTN|nr:LPXTG cell wall anchor domain-containing protein [Streptomyces kaniharaensis]